MKKTIIFPDNSKYVGEVKNDKPHGKGTLIQKKQAKKFNVNDFFDDQGNLDHEKFHWHENEAFFDKIFPETIKYVGEWKNGKQHGKGTYTKTSNQVEKYVGEWINGKRHGKGIFTNSALKLKYVGEWKNDKRHGIGIFTTIDGMVIKGFWKNGSLIKKLKN